MSFFYNLLLKYRLVLEKFFNKRFKPDFSDHFFISSLSESSTILQNVRQEYSTGNVRKSQELIVKHFRTRSTPIFFLNANDVKRLVIDITNEHPTWRDQTLQSVHNMITEGVDVYSDKTKPLASVNFWKTLKKGVGQDILYQVKPHRFGFAPEFILAMHYGEPTLEVFDRLISSWQEVAEKDYLAYLSDLTVISRIVSLSWAWLFLVALDSKDYPDKWYLEYKLLKIIHLDAVFLSRTEDQSTPNNHLMIYEFSKFYTGTLFPEFSDLKNWTNCQPETWVAELKRQTYSDGGGFEPSLHYHQLFCETAIAYIILCKKNLMTPDSWVEKQLELFLHFQISIAGQSCNSLHIGDSSDHELFPLGRDDADILPSLREIYRFLYQPKIVKVAEYEQNIEKAFWLLSGQIAPSPEPGNEQKENQFCCFNDSGYYIFNDENPRTRLIFRTGPEENCSVFAGHMHSDLLSVYIIVNGVPFFVNSGTYTYRSNLGDWPSGTPPWRKFFMRPESKNTIHIENEDPLGIVNGDFRDSITKARVKVTISHEQPEINWIEAKIIDAGNYSHFRRGVIQLVNNYWVVYDIKGPGSEINPVNMGLQLAANVKSELYERSIILHQDEEQLNLAWSSSLQLSDKLKGSFSPLGGWISEKYGQLRAATYLKFKIENDSKLSAFVLIADESKHPAITVQSSQCVSEITELTVRTEKFTDHILFRNEGSIGRITSDELALSANASMLIIRFDMHNNPLFLKALNMINVSMPEIGLTISCKKSVPWLDFSLIECRDIKDDEILVEWMR